MPTLLNLYIDDSGARDPDRQFDGHAASQDWFALGGFLIAEQDTAAADNLIQAFRNNWPEMKDKPLRSYEIRNRTGAFRWLLDASASRKNLFYSQLTEMIISLPIHVIACVVDRPGYNTRYRVKYGPRRWMLCKTAFTIVVERAAKFALFRNAKLRVFVERSDKEAEEQLHEYYEKMRTESSPFDGGRSARYNPLSTAQLAELLYDFRIKTKQSLLLQIADLVLWPICKNGYEEANRNYRELREGGKLAESLCTPENGLQGTKYSCFD